MPLLVSIFIGGALRVFFGGLITILLPFVLKGIIVWFMGSGLTYLQSALGVINVQLPQISFNLSGWSGYIASNLRLLDCLHVLMSAMLTKMSWKFIPKMGGK